jgi:hypothetical protein
LVWLGLVLAATALWAVRPAAELPPEPAPSAVPPAGFRLSLELRRPESKDGAYVLQLRETPQGGEWYSLLYVNHTVPPGPLACGNITPGQLTAFRSSLEGLGLWTVPDGVEKGKDVLRTELSVEDGKRQWHSTWIGLPGREHRALAEAFLAGPFGADIRTGLAEVRRLSRPTGN